MQERVMSKFEKIEAKEIRKILKDVTCSKISKFLQEDGEYELMLEENDMFIMKNMFYYKKSAKNTAIKLGGYTENGIIYRIDNIIIKYNYDEFIRFLKDTGNIVIREENVA